MATMTEILHLADPTKASNEDLIRVYLALKHATRSIEDELDVLGSILRDRIREQGLILTTAGQAWLQPRQIREYDPEGIHELLGCHRSLLVMTVGNELLDALCKVDKSIHRDWLARVCTVKPSEALMVKEKTSQRRESPRRR